VPITGDNRIGPVRLRKGDQVVVVGVSESSESRAPRPRPSSLSIADGRDVRRRAL
jgi:hypothetical protein